MKKSRNDAVKTALVSYLERRNYPDTEVTSKPTALCHSAEQMAVSAIVENEASRSNSILFSCINNDPSQCDSQYSRFVTFIKDIENETLKNELLAILCPLLCHMYLEMLRGGHRSPAQMFLKRHSASLPQRDQSFHQPVDGNLPSALYRPNSLEQLFNSLQNGTIDNDTPDKDYMSQILDDLGSIYSLQEIETRPMVAAFRSCKYDVQLSQEALNILKKYLARHSHVILMQVLQTWFHIDIINEDSTEQDATELLDGDGDSFDKIHEYNSSCHDTFSVCNGHLDYADPNDELSSLQEAIKSVRDARLALKLYKIAAADNHLICANIDSKCKLLFGGFSNSEIRIWGVGRHQIKKKPNPNISKIELACNISPCEDIRDNFVDNSLGIALRGHTGPIQALNLIESADTEGVLVSVSQDSTIRAWRMSDYSCAAIYRGHNYPVWCLDVAKHGVYMATGSHDRTAKLWSLDRTFPLKIFAGHILDVNCVKFHPNGAYVCTGGADRSVRLWCADSGRQVRVLAGHRAPIHALAFSPDGKYLASAGEDKKIRIWDLTAGSCLQEYRGHTSRVTALDWSEAPPNVSPCRNSSDIASFISGNSVLSSASMDSTVKVWDCQMRQKSSSSNHESTHTTYVSKCSYLVNVRLNSKWLVAIGSNGS